MRDQQGATILVGPDKDLEPGGDPGGADGPAGGSGSHEPVGGVIASHTELYLGRPAGTQNRPAAWVALAGALLMVVGAYLPWATRAPAELGNAELGWWDANGDVGPSAFLMLIAVSVATVAVRCMAGSHSDWWRVALLALGLGAATLGISEALRIESAIDQVADLTRGQVSISFGLGIPVALVGSVLVAVAAGAYRVGSPD